MIPDSDFDVIILRKYPIRNWKNPGSKVAWFGMDIFLGHPV